MNFVFLPLFFLASLTFAGCASRKTPVAANPQSQPSEIVASAPENSETAPPVNLASNTNSTAPAHTNTNVTPSAPSSNVANTIGEQSSLGSLRRGKGNPAPESFSASGNVPTGTATLPAAQPAPDDSEFTVMLTDVAVEIRNFKSHPQLDRVEKRTDEKSSTIKVFLRDGRVVTLPGSKIGSLASARVGEILAAAGLSKNTSPGRPRRPAKNAQ